MPKPKPAIPEEKTGVRDLSNLALPLTEGPGEAKKRSPRLANPHRVQLYLRDADVALLESMLANLSARTGQPISVSYLFRWMLRHCSLDDFDRL